MQRRTFLKTSLLGGGATAILGLSSCTTTTSGARRKVASAEGLVIRREINDPLAQKDLETYRKGVEILRKNPAMVQNASGQNVESGLSFESQAMIHQNHCPHGTWNFFPWHREYLFRYEEVIRAVTGDESFALPYWDWSKNPRLPDAFRDARSSLFINESGRTLEFGSRIMSACHPDRIKMLGTTKDFESFMGSPHGGGPVEYGPHNTIHIELGGTMGTFKSPLDPIFWCHHANVDRLWAEWQESNDFFKREAPVKNYQAWLNQDLKGFYDRKGMLLSPSRKAKDVIDPKDLGYLYDTSTRMAPTDPIPAMPPEFSRNVIAQTEALSALAAHKDKKTGTILVTLPFLDEDMRNIFQSYMENPYDYRDYRFNLKMIEVPDLPYGAKMKVHLVVGKQKIFVLDFVPFIDPASPHAAHMAKGTLNFDYSKVLDVVSRDSGGQYPRNTQFLITLTNKDGTPLVFENLKSFKMKYMLTLLGPSTARR